MYKTTLSSSSSMASPPSLFFITLFSIIIIIINPSHESSLNDHLNLTTTTTYPLNPRLLKAYHALQQWKHHHITSDPTNFTSTWSGPHVCTYTGVFCAPAPDDPHLSTVAAIDLNHANLSGTLPDHLPLLLPDLALLHLNSNRFCGPLPSTLPLLRLLHELDLSNNQFSGPFPDVVLSLPSLKFLDLRFNSFHGPLPPRLFDTKLDALFLNDNKFKSSLPANFGNSTVSVIVFANNYLEGSSRSCFPPSIGRMKETLNEILIVNSGLRGCLPEEIGELQKVTVFDVSGNELVGELPAEAVAGMKRLEQFNVAGNKFSGDVPASVCELPTLKNFTYSFNYFCSEASMCLKLPAEDDRRNCFPDRPLQRSESECEAFYKHPVDCGAFGCEFRRTSPPLPPPSPSPSPSYPSSAPPPAVY